MNRLLSAAIPLLLASLVSPSGVSAGEPPALRHNPFARPPSAVLPDDPSEQPPLNPDEMPALLATMVSTQGKLANVGGRILGPGDEIYGFRLLQIFEDRVVFERQGRRTTVYVRPQPEENND